MNKKTLALAVGAALAAPTVSHAVKYKLSGQINRAAVYHNDGQASDVQFIDNNASGTRWRMKGSEDIGGGQKVGFNWEWQVQSNQAGGPIRSPDLPLKQDLRKAEVWFSGGWGKLNLGQGDGAGNGTTEHDLSNTWNVNYAGRDSYAGAVAWRTAMGGALTSMAGTGITTSAGTAALTHGATFNHFDAFSRYDRVRYDSPALGPVTASVSAGQADKYEGGVRWNQGLGGGQISAGLFYGVSSSAKNRYGGSAAYLFSFGTNLLFQYSENEPILAPGAPITKGKTWYVKVGHRWGNNSASVGYGESKDASPTLASATPGFKNKGFNAGYNYNIPKAKVDLYAGYHFHNLDTPSTAAAPVEDIHVVVLGTKLKFD